MLSQKGFNGHAGQDFALLEYPQGMAGLSPQCLAQVMMRGLTLHCHSSCSWQTIGTRVWRRSPQCSGSCSLTRRTCLMTLL